jgi:hypothetical protein
MSKKQEADHSIRLRLNMDISLTGTMDFDTVSKSKDDCRDPRGNRQRFGQIS